MPTLVDQAGASASGDVVGGDKITVAVVMPTLGVVGQLLEKLQQEVEANAQVRHTVEALARYHVRRPTDGIEGLEAKLKAAEREEELHDAIEQKEQFAKLLETWGFYSSAQEIFAFLLARIVYEFTNFILPELENLTIVQINQIIDDKIVSPTITECGASIFRLNHDTVMGMIYWLAEQCYVRWHK